MARKAEKKKKPLAVVTGASSGIGYELAKQFAENGFDLLVCAEDKGIVEAAQAFKGMGAKVESMQVDLRNRSEVQKFYEKIKSCGPVEAIALNAGVGVGGDFVDETDLKDELDIIKLNIVSVVHLTKLVAKDMVAQGHGKILFTSSIAAILPGPFVSVYAGTKGFIENFAMGIRSELKDKGVTVTSLLPGPTDTNFFERADMMDTKAGTDKKDDPALVAKQGFQALMSGQDSVIAGSLLNKVQGVIGKILPDKVAAAVHRRLTEPGTGKA